VSHDGLTYKNVQRNVPQEESHARVAFRAHHPKRKPIPKNYNRQSHDFFLF
jgi:hypothetical protein